MHILNETRNQPLIAKARVADTFWLRLRGLLGAKSLAPGEGLILVGEKSIHTLFMGFAIDVVYVDKDYKVIRTQEDMGPYRLGPFVGRASYVLEMPVGTIAHTATQIGDQLRFVGE
ncbi:MAG TPA: DUF192 domain-containing protein [Anaerolineae bacterium]|nr:DUF192 domain-containing protein [Anaerolineae bacterium]